MIAAELMLFLSKYDLLTFNDQYLSRLKISIIIVTGT